MMLVSPAIHPQTWNEHTSSRMKWGLIACTILKVKIKNVVFKISILILTLHKINNLLLTLNRDMLSVGSFFAYTFLYKEDISKNASIQNFFWKIWHKVIVRVANVFLFFYSKHLPFLSMSKFDPGRRFMQTQTKNFW